jgi:hypothetical protein
MMDAGRCLVSLFSMVGAREAASSPQSGSLSYRLLAPAGADNSAICSALGAFGFEPAEDAAFDALVVAGELDVRAFIDRDAGGYGVISSPVIDEIRAAHGNGKWIGAPGVALALVLRGLEREIAAGAANRRSMRADVIVFEDIRVVANERPMFGRPGRSVESLGRLAAVLAQRVSDVAEHT